MARRTHTPAALLIALFTLAVQAADPPALPTEPHVVVTGTGRATAKPDYLEITLEVSATRDDGQQAKSTVDATTTAVLGALRTLGLQREHVTTSSATLDVIRDYEQDAQPVIGYTADRRVEVELRDMTLLDQLVEAVTAAGATSIWSPRVRSRQEGQLEQQALGQAIENARAEARSLARALGRSLGPAYGIATREARSWRGAGRGSLFGDPADDDTVDDWLTYVPPPVDVAKDVYVVFLLGPATQGGPP